MEPKALALTPQQVGFKRSCSRLYSAYGDEFFIEGIDATRDYVTGRMLKDLQMADTATLGHVLHVVEGVLPRTPAGKPFTRHYMIGLIALRMKSASWDTLALVAETLRGDAGQAEAASSAESPARKQSVFHPLVSSAARLRAGTRAGCSALVSFPFRAFVKHLFLKHVTLRFLGFVLAVTTWAAVFLLTWLLRRLQAETRLGGGRRCARGERYVPARLDNSRADARQNMQEVSHGDG